MPDQYIAGLIERLLQNTITPEEKEILARWVMDHGDEMDLSALMEGAWNGFQPGQSIPEEKAGQLLTSVLARAKGETGAMREMGANKLRAETEAKSPVRRLPRLRMLYRLAAAILIFAIVTGAGMYFLLRPAGSGPVRVASRDISPPASSNAILTLSDGKTIVLDSAVQGNIAIQRRTAIIKNGDGDIAYRPNGPLDSTGFNMLTVPRGSRIAHLTLSDGTNVWLNAGSSIRYPVVFTGSNRSVSVTGESYFEVARDPAHPFQVTKGANRITVLGTHFNVNAYEEEGDMKVTLLEGAVKVDAGSGGRLLAPGQMATIGTSRQIGIQKEVDLERVMAWKNGYFDFASADIQTVMRELARWYGLELTFNDPISEKFHVGISRDIPLSRVLNILEMTGAVHFSISGKKVTVMR